MFDDDELSALSRRMQAIAAGLAESAREQLMEAERLAVRALELQESAQLLTEYAEELLLATARHIGRHGLANSSTEVVQHLRGETDGPPTERCVVEREGEG